MSTQPPNDVQTQNPNEAWLYATFAALALAYANEQQQETSKVETLRNTIIHSMLTVFRGQWHVWVATQNEIIRQAIIRDFNKDLDELNTRIKQLHIDRELAFEDAYRQRSFVRMQDAIMDLKDVKLESWPAQVRHVLAQEKHFEKLHVQATKRRIRLTKEYIKLRMVDPRSETEGGALWKLDKSKKTHTPDCLVMAEHVWSWAVLRYIHPANRHMGCGCTLHKANFSVTPRNYFPAGVPTGWDIGVIA